MDSGANPDASTIKKTEIMGANKLRHMYTEPLIFTRKVSAYIPQLLNGKLANLKAGLSKLGNKAVKAVSAKVVYSLMAVAA